MATMTITAPAARRTVVERRTTRAFGPVATPTVRIPSAATLYAASPAGVRTVSETPARSAESTAAAPTTSSAAPVRLTRRGRRLARTAVIVLALVAALAFSIAGRSASSQATDGPAVAATTTVVVQPGQTLWSVARTLSPDTDVRETVARIQELNGLTGSSVIPGQSLVVPVIG